MFNSVIHVLSGHGRIPAHRAFMGLNSFYYSSLEYFFVLFFFSFSQTPSAFWVSTLCWTLFLLCAGHCGKHRGYLVSKADVVLTIIV